MISEGEMHIFFVSLLPSGSSHGMLIVPAVLQKTAELMAGLVMGLSLRQATSNRDVDVMKEREEWLRQREAVVIESDDEGYTLATELQPRATLRTGNHPGATPVDILNLPSKRDDDVLLRSPGASMTLASVPPTPPRTHQPLSASKSATTSRAWLPRKLNKPPENTAPRKTSAPPATGRFAALTRKLFSKRKHSSSSSLVRRHSDENLAARRSEDFNARRQSKDDGALEELRRRSNQPNAPEDLYLKPVDDFEPQENEYAEMAFPPSHTSQPTLVHDNEDMYTEMNVTGSSVGEGGEEYYTPMEWCGPVSPQQSTSLAPASQVSSGSVLIDDDYLPMSELERSPRLSHVFAASPPDASKAEHRMSFLPVMSSPDNDIEAEIIADQNEQLTLPKAYEDNDLYEDLDAEAYSVMPVKDASELPVSRGEPEAYVIHDLDDESEIGLANVDGPEDIPKLSSNKLKALLRINSIHYEQGASKENLIEKAQQLWQEGRRCRFCLKTNSDGGKFFFFVHVGILTFSIQFDLYESANLAWCSAMEWLIVAYAVNCQPKQAEGVRLNARWWSFITLGYISVFRFARY